MTTLKRVRFNQEFLYFGEINHLVMRNARQDGKTTLVEIRNRRGVREWIDWDTEVEICEHSPNK
jgi:hypothetical protein